MADMTYDRGALQTLIDQLDTHHRNLGEEIHRLERVAQKLISVAWEENNSATAFQQAHKNWANEFSDTHVKIERLRDAVDTALGNAFAADQKVYNSFA